MKDTKTTLCGLGGAVAAAMLALPGLPAWLELVLKLTVAGCMGALGFFARDRVSGAGLLMGASCLLLAGCASPPWLHLKLGSPAFGTVEFGLHPGALGSTNSPAPRSLP